MLTSLTFYLDMIGRRATDVRAKIEEAAVGVRLIAVLQQDGQDLDISDATTREICIRSPNGIDKTLTASFVTDGTDGRIYYDTIVTDLDELGAWKLAAHVVGPTFDRKSPSFGLFQVVASIC